jgi:hypothetical protein
MHTYVDIRRFFFFGRSLRSVIECFLSFEGKKSECIKKIWARKEFGIFNVKRIHFGGRATHGQHQGDQIGRIFVQWEIVFSGRK